MQPRETPQEAGPPVASVDVGAGAGVAAGVDSGRALTPPEFAEHFAASYKRLWGLAAALIGDRVEAEDLVQEAALVGLRKIDTFERGTSFQAWMGRVLRLHAMNWRRKQAGRRTTPADPVSLGETAKEKPGAAGGGQTTSGAALAAAGVASHLEHQFDDTVMRSLATLDETPRACLLLRVVYDMSYDEIAELLEVPQGTAMSHVHRSKSKLRALVGTEQPADE